MSIVTCARQAGLLFSLPAALAAGASPETTTTCEQARAAFLHPRPDHSTGPLWVWNDLLTDEQVTSTLHDLASQHIRQVFVHPRPGLATPYMSDEWMRLWKVALDEAQKLGMSVWIYDENSYPSGFAGGLVPEAMPESIQKGMVFHHEQLPSPLTSDTLAVFRMTGDPENGDRAEEIMDELRRGDSFTTGTYLTVRVQSMSPSAWYADRTYVDLLNPAVTEKFLEVTFEPYRKKFGEHFGTTIVGAFTDEPNIRIHEIAWTPRLPELFRERWGYDLMPQLASLSLPIGDWKRVRHNFWQLLNELFVSSWAKPYHDYCQKHGLEVTGHYWDHEWPNIMGVPDNMAMYAWMQRPAIDCLMNIYEEHTHGQFGNARMARELSSIANQMGRERTLCEIYGAAGWDLRFEDMKRIADWLAVIGVNTFNEHLSYISLRGARKRDHPQSFSYHTPWWPDYHVMADYMTRLSAALSQGRQINRVLLFQPTTTAFLYQARADSPDRLKHVGDDFQNLHIALERAQVEYDIGSEYLLAEAGAVEGKELRVGKCRYHTILLPPGTENLNAPTLKLLEQFGAAGGRIILCGEAPALIDGVKSDRATTASKEHGWTRLNPTETASTLKAESADGFQVRWKNDANGILFHQRRQLADGELLFLVNTSIDQPASGSWISGHGQSVELWDLATGLAQPASFKKTADGIEAEFTLPPCGSQLLLIKRDWVEADSATAQTAATVIAPTGKMTVSRDEPNVLTLDYVDLTVAGETERDIYFYAAAQKAYQKHGLRGNPWEKAIQFKDEILRTPIPADSGFEATYHFAISGKVPEELTLVLERPDLYQVTCNDQPLSATTGWWLDRSFLKMDVASLVRTGDNRITITAAPLTVFHEIEPVYLLGDFGLESGEKGFTIVPVKLLQSGSWQEQGHPFYGHSVSYTQTFRVREPSGRYAVSLGKWHGALARVRVNGQEAGKIAWAPWECDVTDMIRRGDNEIEVTVVGTLKNPLGPHHAGDRRGAGWPVDFHKGPQSGPPPGRDYNFIDYGLFEPFVLKESR